MSNAHPLSPSAVQVGDSGFPIRIRVQHRDATGTLVTTNISSASVLQVKLLSPNGVGITKPGVLVTDGSDGEFEYIVEAGVIDTDGIWEPFGYLELADGWKGHTQYGLLNVEPLPF